MGVFTKLFPRNVGNIRFYSRRGSCNSYECKLLVVGAGAGGCSVAWRFARTINPKHIIIVEPSAYHYYQPLFTLIAAGIKPFEECRKPTKSVLPPGVTWLKDHVELYEPQCNTVVTRNGSKLRYDCMVIAVGLKNDYDKIPGLKSCLDNKQSPVCTIYAPEYCHKTWCLLRNLRGGHALFTFPDRAAKCSGAAQKIMYLTDDYFRRNKLRDALSITYNTAGKALFGVSKYSSALNRIANQRCITVNCNMCLSELVSNGAVFIDSSGEKITFPYNFLHVTPPMSPPASLANCKSLVNEGSELDVDKFTLQHKCYPNVYGLGDCTNTPNGKTAAAVAKQSCILEKNLTQTMLGRDPTCKYDGYSACPILTSYKRGILAEFLYDKKIHETFPFDQSKENRILFFLNKNVLPYLYWNRLITGKWDNPSKIKKLLNPFNKN